MIGSGPNNDSFYVVNLNDNSSTTSVLTTKGNSIEAPPDGSKSLTWNSNSKVYIYLTSGVVTLDYIFTGNEVAPSGKTNTIKFSADGQLAII